MPIYEYSCTTCGKNFDVMQSMSDDALTRCSAALCVREDGKRKGGGRVSRVLFAPAIHFKGSGFHNTDYGTRKRPPGSADSDSGGSKNGDGASSGGDSAAKSGSGGGGSSSAGESKKTVGLDKV